MSDSVPGESAGIGPVDPSPVLVAVGGTGSGEWSRRRWTAVAVAVSLAAMVLVGAAVRQWTDGAPNAGGGGSAPGGQANVTTSASPSSAPPSVVPTRPSPVGHVAESTTGPAETGNREVGVAYPPTVGARIGLEPVSRPGFRVRHRNSFGRIDRIGPGSSQFDRADSSFTIRRGLADPRCFSFESVNFPGFYLRHQNFVVRLHRHDNSALYRHDTTFCVVGGLAGEQLSFRSFNYPDRFLGHRVDHQLTIDPVGRAPATRQAMTFAVRPALLPASD